METNHSETTRLVQISDLHCYADDDAMLEWSDIPLFPNKSLQRLLTHLRKNSGEFDAMVISGDLAQEETAATYKRINQLLHNLPWPIYILPGNHDVPGLIETELVQQNNNTYFQLDQTFSNWLCLFLDTHLTGHPDGHLSDAQFTEIETRLKQLPSNEHAIIFMHHHPLSIGSPWMDTMGLQQSNTFWELIASYPQVRSVVFGHIHSEFVTQHHLSDTHTVAVYGTPATCVQVKHIDENLNLDHARPAWRELTLHSDGKIETCVHYLPEESVQGI